MRKLKGNQNVRNTETGRFSTETERNDPERSLETDKPKLADLRDLVSPKLFDLIQLGARLERLSTDRASQTDLHAQFGELVKYAADTWL
jgi:hypothetical protein